MRIAAASSILMAACVASCASTPTAGPLGEGFALRPTITAVDTVYPPRSVWVQLDQPGYAAVLLVAPGHSATLLYPSDSLMSNQLTGGAHLLTFQIPGVLVAADSMRDPRRPRARPDTTRNVPETPRVVSRTRRQPAVPPLPPLTPTYLLLVTSPQQLSYSRIIEKTAGVSIPTIEEEALNAVGKAIKSTLTAEPREWAGYYQRIALRRPS